MSDYTRHRSRPAGPALTQFERSVRRDGVIDRTRRLVVDVQLLARHASVPLLERFERRLREFENEVEFVRRSLRRDA